MNDIDWGKPIRTRGGLPLTILHLNLSGNYPILCLVKGLDSTRALTYTRKGLYDYELGSEGHPMDAVQATEEDIVEINHKKMVDLLDKFVYHDCICGDCDHVDSKACAIAYFKFAMDTVKEADLYV